MNSPRSARQGSRGQQDIPRGIMHSTDGLDKPSGAAVEKPADPRGQGVVSADHLRKLGLALCKPDAGTKNPTEPGWTTRSKEPEDFGPNALYGVICGPLSNYNR